MDISQKDIAHLLIVWGIITAALLIYIVILRSSGWYKVRKQFWSILLLTFGGSYVLSAILLLVAHWDYIFVMMVTLLVAFVIQGDVGLRKDDTPPSPPAVMEEPELVDDEY